MHVDFWYLFVFFFNDPATTEIYTLSYTTLFRSPHQSGQHATHQRPLHEGQLEQSDNAGDFSFNGHGGGKEEGAAGNREGGK